MAARGLRRVPVDARRRHGTGPYWWWILLPIVAAPWVGLVQAADWDIEPNVRLAQTWTDNIELAAEDPQHEWITEVTPGLSVRGEGRRASLDLRYRYRNLFHAREPGRDRANHEIAADGTTELVRERLYFDASAVRIRDILSGDGVGPEGDVFGGGTRSTITTWGLGPRLQHEFGRTARMLTSYRREHVESSAAEATTTDSDLFAFALTSGPLFTTWGWAADYSRREETRDSDNDVDDKVVLERVRGEINLRAAPATQLFVAGGYEQNRFESADDDTDIDGEFWEAGLRWRPSRRLALEVAGGERFFGKTARASLDIQGNELSIRLAYAEDLITTAQLLTDRAGQLVLDPDGNLVIGDDGQPITGVDGIPTVPDDVILQRRAEMRAGWTRGYSDLRMTVLAADREFQRLGISEQAHRADLSWTWTRMRRTALSAGVAYTYQEFAGEIGREDDTYALRLGASRNITTDMDLVLDYEGFVRDSSVDGAEYRVNQITLALEKRF